MINETNLYTPKIPRKTQALIELYAQHEADLHTTFDIESSGAFFTHHFSLKETTKSILHYLNYVKEEKRKYNAVYWGFNPYKHMRKSLINLLKNTAAPEQLREKAKQEEEHWETFDELRKQYILEAALHDQSNEPEFAQLSHVVSHERLEKINKRLMRKRGSKTTKDDKTYTSTSSTFEALQEEALIKLGRQV